MTKPFGGPSKVPQEWIRMLRAGLTAAQIAKRVGESTDTVHKALWSAGAYKL